MITKQPFMHIFMCAALCMFLQPAFSQNLSLGVRAGILLNNATVSPKTSNTPDLKSQIGYQAAVSLEIGLGSMFAIQPELMLGQHGFKFDESSVSNESGYVTTSKTNGNLTATCLEIPLLAKVKFGSDNLKFHVLAGPSIGFGLSGKSKNDFSIKTVSPSGTVVSDLSGSDESTLKMLSDGYDPTTLGDKETAFAKTNFNLHLGAGVSFMMGNASLFLDARYIIGLSSLEPSYKDQPTDEKETVKSNRIGISVGVMFPLGGK